MYYSSCANAIPICAYVFNALHTFHTLSQWLMCGGGTAAATIVVVYFRQCLLTFGSVDGRRLINLQTFFCMCARLPARLLAIESSE